MGRGRRLLVVGWVLLGVGVLGIVASLLAFRGEFGSATVRSESMTPTYGPGDGILFERVGGSEVRRGDVVLITLPERYGPDPVVKRVIGVGGDRIVCCRGERAGQRISVDGRPLVEPYVKDGIANGSHPLEYDVRVPEGRLFLLGDHRLNSRDSRYFLDDHDGTVPVDAVRGRVTEGRARVAPYAVAGLLGLAAVVGLCCALAGRGARRSPAQHTVLWPEHL
ncbi:signal peptidase I [Streptomyces sp. NPDC006610]|uniref:signal peptidase I n=1 Tax=Streptomyces sp. NPDC006610 TaxID=3154584 RepID=UPI0033A6C09E